jgi:hypothetical protein
MIRWWVTHTCMNNALPCNFSQTSYSTSRVNFSTHSPNCRVLTLVAFIHCSWVMHDTELYNINRTLYTRPDLCSLDHILFWRHNSDCQRQEAFLRGFRGTPPSSPPTLAPHPPEICCKSNTKKPFFALWVKIKLLYMDYCMKATQICRLCPFVIIKQFR